MSKQTRILRFFEKKIVGTHAHNPKVVGVNPDAPVEVVVGVNPEVPVEVATVVTDESKLLKKVTPEGMTLFKLGNFPLIFFLFRFRCGCYIQGAR